MRSAVGSGATRRERLSVILTRQGRVCGNTSRRSRSHVGSAGTPADHLSTRSNRSSSYTIHAELSSCLATRRHVFLHARDVSPGRDSFVTTRPGRCSAGRSTRAGRWRRSRLMRLCCSRSSPRDLDYNPIKHGLAECAHAWPWSKVSPARAGRRVRCQVVLRLRPQARADAGFRRTGQRGHRIGVR